MLRVLRTCSYMASCARRNTAASFFSAYSTLCQESPPQICGETANSMRTAQAGTAHLVVYLAHCGHVARQAVIRGHSCAGMRTIRLVHQQAADSWDGVPPPHLPRCPVPRAIQMPIHWHLYVSVPTTTHGAISPGAPPFWYFLHSPPGCNFFQEFPGPLGPASGECYSKFSSIRLQNFPEVIFRSRPTF